MVKIKHIIGLPLVFVVSQFFMTIIATVIFILTRNHANLETWIGSDSYTNELAHFFSNYSIVITLVTCAIFLPIFYHFYHREVKTKKRNISFLEIVFLVILGSSFSLLYQAILESLSEFVNFVEINHSKPLFSLIISTVFIGPILEEYLFRGIIYHRLQTYYPIMKSLLLTGLIFGLCHTNLFQIIYAFIFNFILIFAYEKFDLKASMIVHMSGNAFGLLFGIFDSTMMTRLLCVMISSILLVVSYRMLERHS